MKYTRNLLYMEELKITIEKLRETGVPLMQEKELELNQNPFQFIRNTH